MTIISAVFSGGADGAQVVWYTSTAASSQPGGHPLYGSKGSFNVANSNLDDLVDIVCYLGRSMEMKNLKNSGGGGVLKLIAEDRTSKEIAELLKISTKTVENHRHNICRKLNIYGSHSLLKSAFDHKSYL